MDKIREFGGGKIFLLAVGLQTLSTILALAGLFVMFSAPSIDPFFNAIMNTIVIFAGIIGAALAALPLIGLWLILDASKNKDSDQVDGKKIFTALKLIQVHLIINICVFGFAIGMALLGLMIDAILGGVITAQQPPNMLLDIIFVYSATLLQSIMALMMVKGLRDGLYSGSFAPLRGSLVFTIVTGVIIIYSLVMLFLSPAILADMVAQNDMILLLMPNLPMGGLHIGTFASIANILALILYLVLLHQFNNAVKEDATRNL